MDKFSEWLVIQLREKNWSQSELARKAKISPQVISDYINGKRKKPDETILRRIAKAFNVSPETIFEIVGYLPPKEQETKTLAEINYLISTLPPEQQDQVYTFVRFLCETKGGYNAKAKYSTK